MNNQVKSKKELLNELLELSEKYESLKISKATVEEELFLAKKEISSENTENEKSLNKPKLSKTTQDKIEESENRYQTLFKSMPYGFVLFEVVENNKGVPIDLIIIDANERFAITTGLTLNDAIGKHLTHVLPGIEKDAADWIGTYSKVALTGKPAQFEQGSELLGYYYSVTAYKSGPKRCAVIFEDITERKQIKTDLLNSEKKFSILFGKASTPAALTQIPGHEFVDVNDAWIKLFGFSKEEIIGKTSVEIGLNREVKRRAHLKDKLKKNTKLSDLELNFFSKTGEKITVLSNVNVAEINGKEFAIISMHDITEKKKTEDAYKKTLANLKSLIDNRKDAIWSVDTEYNYLIFNEFYASEFFNAFNFNVEIGMCALDTLTPEAHDFWVPKYESVFAGDSFIFGFERIIDGKNSYFQISLNPIFENNIIIGVSGISINITQQKLKDLALLESEELLRLSSELANVAAWEMDLVNDNMTRSSNHDNLYGLTGVGQWHVNTFLDATHIDDREKCNAFINQSLAPGGPNQYKFDFRIHYPDKSIHWLNVIGEVIERDENGVGIKIRGFINDITDRMEAETALKQSEEKFSSAFYTSPAAMSIARSTDGLFIDANLSFLNIFEFKREEVIGHTSLELNLIDPEDRAKINQKIKETGSLNNIELTLKSKSGKNIDLLLSTKHIKIMDEDYNLTTMIDISELKKAEMELKKYQEHLEELIKERTKVIENKNTTLEKMNKLFVGRELRMKDLKAEIEKLKSQS